MEKNILSSNWQHKFLYFHYKLVKLDVLLRQIKYEHLPIISNLETSQFAPGIVICSLCICCKCYCIMLFEDSQIILPKIVPMSHQHFTVTNEGSFFAEKKISSFWYIILNF